MLPRSLRFSRRLFQRAFSRAKKERIEGQLFLLSKTNREPRFAVVVGKKVSRSAVKRNRLRRQLYEILRAGLVGKMVDKNVIFLYRGAEILEAPTREKIIRACRILTKKS